ncbi:MAG TPA: hypothetical protein VJ205_03515 [Gammaproteobacteria bacterium]|nr:hypothetical protein [Gammaproteobacteria bacterium]
MPISSPVEIAESTDLILDKIADNGRNQFWLKDWAQRNSVTISTLIANDVFGSLSDFPEKYPDATLADKLNILQAYLDKKSLSTFDVTDITMRLTGWCDLEERLRNVENALFSAQWQRSCDWSQHLTLSAGNWVEILCQMQILDVMENMLDQEAALKEKDEMQAMIAWFFDKREALLNTGFPLQTRVINGEVEFALLGSNQFSKFFRTEINILRVLWQTTMARISDIAAGRVSSIFGVAIDSAWFVIRLGLMALLPYRLLVTALRELEHFIDRRLWPRLLPNVRVFLTLPYFVSKIVVFALAIHYFNIPLLLFFGLQIFPYSWTWGLIGKIALGFGSLEVLSGAVYGIAKKLTVWWQDPVRARRLGAEVSSPADAPSSTRVVEVENEEDLGSSRQGSEESPSLRDGIMDDSSELNVVLSSQSDREALTRILMRYQLVLGVDPSINEAEKTEKRKTVATELGKLRGVEPYRLSRLDDGLIQEKKHGEMALPAPTTVPAATGRHGHRGALRR